MPRKSRTRTWLKKLDKLPKMIIRKDPTRRRSPVYGAVYTLSSGELLYVAYRRHKEIFRSGKQTISEAVQDGIACWAIDNDTALARKNEGVRFVAFLEKDTDDLWVTPLERFFDKSLSRVHNYEARGGALQHYLPLEHFELRAGV